MLSFLYKMRGLPLEGKNYDIYPFGARSFGIDLM